MSLDLKINPQTIKSLFSSSCPILTRFAPSPTGYLHMGHVVSAIYCWGIAKLVGGSVLLRIEDHDLQRSSKHFSQEIIKDLLWLGFISESDLSSIVYQSKRDKIYKEYFSLLQAKAKIYYCTCTRKNLLPGGVYPGSCRNTSVAPSSGEYCLRLRVDNRDYCFWDYKQAYVTQNPSKQCGDYIIKDKKGNWTYQFASVVDDSLAGINLIIRGEDLFASTGRQLFLHSLLRTNPRKSIYVHHRLVREKDSGLKLSKRFLSESISQQRHRGVDSKLILGKALHSLGLISNIRKVNVTQLADLISTSCHDNGLRTC
jgi:glutamyl-Q tRNA(Asp) synthetase